MVLGNLGKYEEALEIYREVLAKKQIVLGRNHADTLRTLNNIAGLLFKQNKHSEATKAYEELIKIQKTALGPNHPETLNAQYNLGNIYMAQGKRISALKAYKECFEQRNAIFGPNNPSVLDIAKLIEAINLTFKIQGSNMSHILQHLQKDINIAANNGDIATVQRLLKEGVDVDDRDVDGRTPLHYAVSSAHLDVVNILINHGADVTGATNKGNTPLHTAASQGHADIVEVLLRNVGDSKVCEFVNAKTISGGTTSLHVAAKSGFLGVVKVLLRYGACYEARNNEGKTPMDLCCYPEVTRLFKLVLEVFAEARDGNSRCIRRLKAVQRDEFLAVTNARNSKGNTLLQEAIVNKRKSIVEELLAMLKRPDGSL